MKRFLAAVAVGLVALAACSDDAPVNVAGTYSLNFTKQANGCKLDNWVVGDQSSGIPIDILQDKKRLFIDFGQ